MSTILRDAISYLTLDCQSPRGRFRLIHYERRKFDAAEAVRLCNEHVSRETAFRKQHETEEAAAVASLQNLASRELFDIREGERLTAEIDSLAKVTAVVKAAFASKTFVRCKELAKELDELTLKHRMLYNSGQAAAFKESFDKVYSELAALVMEQRNAESSAATATAEATPEQCDAHIAQLVMEHRRKMFSSTNSSNDTHNNTTAQSSSTTAAASPFSSPPFQLDSFSRADIEAKIHRAMNNTTVRWPQASTAGGIQQPQQQQQSVGSFSRTPNSNSSSTTVVVPGANLFSQVVDTFVKYRRETKNKEEERKQENCWTVLAKELETKQQDRTASEQTNKGGAFAPPPFYKVVKFFAPRWALPQLFFPTVYGRAGVARQWNKYIERYFTKVDKRISNAAPALATISAASTTTTAAAAASSGSGKPVVVITRAVAKPLFLSAKSNTSPPVEALRHKFVRALSNPPLPPVVAMAAPFLSAFAPWMLELRDSSEEHVPRLRLKQLQLLLDHAPTTQLARKLCICGNDVDSAVLASVLLLLPNVTALEAPRCKIDSAAILSVLLDIPRLRYFRFDSYCEGQECYWQRLENKINGATTAAGAGSMLQYRHERRHNRNSYLDNSDTDELDSDNDDFEFVRPIKSNATATATPSTHASSNKKEYDDNDFEYDDDDLSSGFSCDDSPEIDILGKAVDDFENGAASSKKKKRRRVRCPGCGGFHDDDDDDDDEAGEEQDEIEEEEEWTSGADGEEEEEYSMDEEDLAEYLHDVGGDGSDDDDDDDDSDDYSDDDDSDSDYETSSKGSSSRGSTARRGGAAQRQRPVAPAATAPSIPIAAWAAVSNPWATTTNTTAPAAAASSSAAPAVATTTSTTESKKARSSNSKKNVQRNSKKNDDDDDDEWATDEDISDSELEALRLGEEQKKQQQEQRQQLLDDETAKRAAIDKQQTSDFDQTLALQRQDTLAVAALEKCICSGYGGMHVKYPYPVDPYFGVGGDVPLNDTVSQKILDFEDPANKSGSNSNTHLPPMTYNVGATTYVALLRHPCEAAQRCAAVIIENAARDDDTDFLGEALSSGNGVLHELALLAERHAHDLRRFEFYCRVIERVIRHLDDDWTAERTLPILERIVEPRIHSRDVIHRYWSLKLLSAILDHSTEESKTQLVEFHDGVLLHDMADMLRDDLTSSGTAAALPLRSKNTKMPTFLVGASLAARSTAAATASNGNNDDDDEDDQNDNNGNRRNSPVIGPSSSLPSAFLFQPSAMLRTASSGNGNGGSSSMLSPVMEAVHREREPGRIRRLAATVLFHLASDDPTRERHMALLQAGFLDAAVCCLGKSISTAVQERLEARALRKSAGAAKQQGSLLSWLSSNGGSGGVGGGDEIVSSSQQRSSGNSNKKSKATRGKKRKTANLREQARRRHVLQRAEQRECTERKLVIATCSFIFTTCHDRIVLSGTDPILPVHRRLLSAIISNNAMDPRVTWYLLLCALDALDSLITAINTVFQTRRPGTTTAAATNNTSNNENESDRLARFTQAVRIFTDKNSDCNVLPALHRALLCSRAATKNPGFAWRILGPSDAPDDSFSFTDAHNDLVKTLGDVVEKEQQTFDERLAASWRRQKEIIEELRSVHEDQMKVKQQLQQQQQQSSSSSAMFRVDSSAAAFAERRFDSEMIKELKQIVRDRAELQQFNGSTTLRNIAVWNYGDGAKGEQPKPTQPVSSQKPAATTATPQQQSTTSNTTTTTGFGRRNNLLFGSVDFPQAPAERMAAWRQATMPSPWANALDGSVSDAIPPHGVIVFTNPFHTYVDSVRSKVQRAMFPGTPGAFGNNNGVRDNISDDDDDADDAGVNSYFVRHGAERFESALKSASGTSTARDKLRTLLSAVFDRTPSHGHVQVWIEQNRKLWGRGTAFDSFGGVSALGGLEDTKSARALSAVLAEHEKQEEQEAAATTATAVTAAQASAVKSDNDRLLLRRQAKLGHKQAKQLLQRIELWDRRCNAAALIDCQWRAPFPTTKQQHQQHDGTPEHAGSPLFEEVALQLGAAVETADLRRASSNAVFDGVQARILMARSGITASKQWVPDPTDSIADAADSTLPGRSHTSGSHHQHQHHSKGHRNNNNSPDQQAVPSSIAAAAASVSSCTDASVHNGRVVGPIGPLAGTFVVTPEFVARTARTPDAPDIAAARFWLGDALPTAAVNKTTGGSIRQHRGWDLRQNRFLITDVDGNDVAQTGPQLSQEYRDRCMSHGVEYVAFAFGLEQRADSLADQCEKLLSERIAAVEQGRRELLNLQDDNEVRLTALLREQRVIETKLTAALLRAEEMRLHGRKPDLWLRESERRMQVQLGAVRARMTVLVGLLDEKEKDGGGNLNQPEQEQQQEKLQRLVDEKLRATLGAMATSKDLESLLNVVAKQQQQQRQLDELRDNVRKDLLDLQSVAAKAQQFNGSSNNNSAVETPDDGDVERVINKILNLGAKRKTAKNAIKNEISDSVVDKLLLVRRKK